MRFERLARGHSGSDGSTDSKQLIVNICSVERRVYSGWVPVLGLDLTAL